MAVRLDSVILIAVCSAPAAADVAFFADAASFAAFNESSGSVLGAMETFEESALQSGKSPFPDPLMSGTPNLPAFPTGLAAPGLTIQTNRNPGPLAPRDVPSGNTQALFAAGLSSNGNSSVKVGEDLGILFGITCSIDLIFESGDLHAIGFELSRFQAFGNAGWNIGVFDADDVLIGQYLIDGPVVVEPATTFFGVWSSTTIARINLHDLSLTPSPDAVDNIEMWVPAPGSAAAFGGLVLLALRRRRL